MRRKLSILVVLLLVGVGAAFASARYKSTCGKWFMGPDQTAFETGGDWMDYLGDMNEILCGSRSHKALERCIGDQTYELL